jgi:hypothetical protein
MRFVHPIRFSNFMQVLYFPKHVLFTTIYLFREHKLNHKNYSKQEINMSNFVQATDNEVYMYAKFGCLDVYRFL